MKTSIVGASGPGGHRFRSPQRAVAMVATTNNKAAIARLMPTYLAALRSTSIDLEFGIATYEVATLRDPRSRMNGDRNKSGSALMTIGRKAKRGVPPRSHAAPLRTDTSRAWV